MEHVKKLASFVLAVVMSFSLGTTAFADETPAGTNTGSITVTNATVDASYSVYKVFDLTFSSNADNTKNVAYSYTRSGDSDAFLIALQSDDSPFTLTETQQAGKYSVTLKAGKTDTNVTEFLKANESSLKQVGETKKATSSAVEFSGLDYGYYYVKSTVGGVVTIDSTTPNASVIDKNQKPGWDNGDNNPGKVILDANGNKVTENTVNYGDNVNFSIAVNATSHDGDKEITY